MKLYSRWVLIALVAGSGVLVSCGQEDDLPPTGPAAVQGLGNISLHCGDSSSDHGDHGSGYGAGSKQQVQFEQQRGCSQSYQFQQSKVSDFDFDLDCDKGLVRVRNKGADEQMQTMPIGDDGSVQGQMQFQQQLQSDGKSGQCWVEHRVDFDGKAQCPHPGESGKKSLSMDTKVQFHATNRTDLAAVGISAGPGEDWPGDEPSASPSPSTSPSPSPSPSVSPSPSPSASETPQPWPSPSESSHHGHGHDHDVVICIVTDPCPIEAKSDMSCGGDSGSASNGGGSVH